MTSSEQYARLLFATLLVAACTPAAASSAAGGAVHTTQDARTITVSNGLMEIRVSRADGSLEAIRQCGADGCHDLGVTEKQAAYGAHGDDVANDYQRAMYWDANATVDHPPPGLQVPLKGYYRPGDGEATVRIIADSAERAEISVTAGPTPLFPFSVDHRYAVLRGRSGFYAWARLEHGAGQPAATLFQNRFVVKTVMDGTFDQWAIGGGKFVPIPQAAIAEQVSDATFRLADGSIKTKYMNSVYWSEVPVYGYVGKQRGQQRGLWMIEASPEYHNGGPVKQGQTVHDNVLLRVLQSVHFGASAVTVADGEDWSKVYGPFFVYANRGADSSQLWADASRQYQLERSQWPYSWVNIPGYSLQRGTVRGTVALGGVPAAGAWAILSPLLNPSSTPVSQAGNQPATDWTAQAKGYAFWSRIDADGHFELPNVVPGDYTLSVSGADQPRDLTVPGIHVTAGAGQDLGRINWAPERHGRQLWQIGRFDRSAVEFRNGADDGARQFENFRQYPRQFPHDVDFTVGSSDPARDWNYAQWTVYSERPDWRIHFALPEAPHTQATLTIGFASSQPGPGRKLTDLRVAVNGSEVAALELPKTGTAGYRGSVQDSTWQVKTLQFDGSLLKAGENLITLRHADGRQIDAFLAGGKATPGQVMYDALRLELAP
jgi:rhamnogalacturonan endolyase